jgi:hypothetical protein
VLALPRAWCVYEDNDFANRIIRRVAEIAGQRQ